MVTSIGSLDRGVVQMARVRMVTVVTSSRIVMVTVVTSSRIVSVVVSDPGVSKDSVTQARVCCDARSSRDETIHATNSVSNRTGSSSIGWRASIVEITVASEHQL